MNTPSLIARTFSTLLLLASFTLAAADYTLETVADGLHHPWSVVQLPDGDFLVTERRGRLLHIAEDGTTRTSVSGVPDTLLGGQGGFFDIVLHPGFNDNRLVYLAYARGTAQANGTAIMRARLEGTSLFDAEDILWVKDKKDTVQHYGGRLLFLPDTTLLLTTGDGFDYRDQAQVTSSELGKVLRINDDGSVPADNPFSEPGSERVWTLGHRNPQGLTLDGDSGTTYLHEHGPKGGDEVNVLSPGNNYGWPVVTYGLDYSGAYVSPFTELPGMTGPVHYWVPSIAPSGLAWYNGEHFPEWRGQLLVGALVDKEVRLLKLDKGEVVSQESLFQEAGERIRDVYMGNDGHIYLLTDHEDGRLIRVLPTR